MALRISTTGSDVMIADLGIKVIHPTVNRDLSLEFTAMELKRSEDLTTAINNGNLTVDDGTFSIHADDYDPDELLLQELGVRGDEKYISNAELASVGTTEIISGVFPLALNSTAVSTRNVYCNGGRWITWELEPGDIVEITGNAAAGSYTVEIVSDQQNFIVEEAIPDSTGGQVTIYHQYATTRIGIDDSDFTYVEGANLQEALASIDDRLGITAGSGMTPTTHRELDQLVHQIAEDSYEEFAYSGVFVTNATVWTDSGKTTKIREEQYTYQGSQVQTGVFIQYDEDGIEVERVTETYNYTTGKITSIDRELV